MLALAVWGVYVTALTNRVSRGYAPGGGRRVWGRRIIRGDNRECSRLFRSHFSEDVVSLNGAAGMVDDRLHYVLARESFAGQIAIQSPYADADPSRKDSPGDILLIEIGRQLHLMNSP